MKKQFLKSLVTALVLLAGGVNVAWADDWSVVWSADFSSIPSGITYSVTNGSVSIANGYINYQQGGGSGDRAINTAFTADAFKVDSNWKFEFDWNCGSANANTSYVTFATNEGNAFTLTWAKYATSVVVTDVANTELNTKLPLLGYKQTECSSWSHVTIIGDTDKGVYLTITNGSTTYVDNALVTSTFGYPSSFNGYLGKAVSSMFVDNMTFSTPEIAGFVAAPTSSIIGVDGTSRTLALATLTEGATILWSETAPDESEDFSSWNTYVNSVVTSVDPIYAVATDGSNYSEVSTIVTGAGQAISLNAPVISVADLTTNGDCYNPVLTATSNQNNLLLSPVATISATFNGIEISLPYTVTEDGTLEVTASADGYTSASTEFSVKALYEKSWISSDYSAITADNVASVLGDSWAAIAATGRWASWSATKEPYTYYQQGDGAGANITIDENIRLRNVVLLNMGYGLGRNSTGLEAINFLNSSKGTIAVVKVYKGFGNDISETNTDYAYMMDMGSGIPSFGCNYANLMVQSTYYVPYESPELKEAKAKLQLAIEQAEILCDYEKPGADALNDAMVAASELLYGGEASVEELTAALEPLAQALGTYVYTNMSDDMKQAVALVADNNALTAANVAGIVATANTTDSDELAGLIIAAVANDANGVEDLATAIANAILTNDESGLADAIAAFNAANQPAFDPSKVIVNSGFELSEATTADHPTGNGLGNDYTTTGWTLTPGGEWVNSAVFSYGSSNKLNNTTPPSTDNMGNGGNALGIAVAWGHTQYYRSAEPVTLPAGNYTLKAYAYNAFASAQAMNSLLGFVPTEGDAFISKRTSYPSNEWVEDEVTFTLEQEMEGKFQIGGTAVSGGSANQARVFFDNLVLTYKSPEEIAAEELATAKETLDAEIVKAKDFKIETRTEGLTDYESAIADAESAMESTSLEDVTQAITDLQAAELTFLTANLPIQEGTYYIYNPLTEKFLARGNAYGTAAVVADYGVAINIEAEVSAATPDGYYSLVGFDNNASYGFDEWMYADASGDKVRTYTFAKSGDGFTMTNTNNNMLVYVYLKEDGNKYRVAGNAIKNDNYTDDAQTVWQFITPDAYNTMIADRIAAEKTAAFTAAGIAEDDEVVSGEPVELTFASGHAWTQTVVRTQENQPATNANGTEMWQATGSYTQTVTGLESGLYKVSIQAFYRNGGADECVTRYSTGYNTVLAYLDANGSKVQVKSWATDKGEGNNPNSMEEAKSKFDAGKYLSETYAFVGDDGKLNLAVYNPAHIGNGWFIVGNVTYTPQYPLTAIATTDDYDALNEAIEAAPTLGFLAGEAAPYNNVDVLKTLATAKSIDKTANNLASTVQELTDALAADKWTINTEEVNAVYDGSFGAAENDGAPAGWETTHANGLGGSLHARTFVLTSGMGNYNNLEAFGQGDGTRSAFYIRFDGTNSAQGTWYSYGKTEDYTMPLEANTAYRLSLQAGAWGDYANKQLSVTIKDAEGNNVVEKTLKTTKKTSSGEGVDDLDFVFTTNEAGNYTLSLWNANGANYAAIVSNIELYRAKTTVTMAVTDAQYATFCAPFDVTIPEDVTAYTIEGDDDGTNVLPMNEVTTGTISANTPVVLYSESAFSKDVEGVAVSAENLNYGWLTGVYEDTPVTAGMYVLQNQKGTVAFYMVGEESTTPDVPAYHAYMTIPSGSEARAYYFGGNATAISALQTLTSGDAEIYDVNGRKQVKLQKGVNIIRTKDGRTQKVMMK